MVAPPLYRNHPMWYQRGLTQIAARFSVTFSEGKPDNLFLLPSFSSQDLLPDGAFLTPVSGLHYVLHLFDSSEAALDLTASSGNVQFGCVKENVRLHDDRMAFIERRHDHLQRRVDHKIAIDAEFSDWVTNRSEEDWLVVQGLPRLSSDLSNHDWQEAAKKQVTELIKFVLNIDRSNVRFTVLLVLNPFRHIPTRPPLYNVRMDSVASSSRIREIYSGFFRKERPMKLPPSLKGVSIRNKITLNTKIRLAILREVGSIYKESNKGSFYKANGYTSRPFLVTTPPRGAGRPRKYTFMQAVTSLKATFSDANLIKIFQTINDHHPGELQALFVVIKDDDRERILELVRAERASGSQGRSGQGSGASHSAAAPASTTSGFVFGSGSGMDLEANFLSSLRSPPPPPPPEAGRVQAALSPEKTKGSTSFDRRIRRSQSRERESPRGRSRERSPSRSRKSGRSRSRDRRGRSRERSPSRSRKSGRSRSRDRKSPRGWSRERSPSCRRKSRRSRSHDSPSPGRGLKRNHLSSSRERDVDIKKRKRNRRRSSSTSSSESQKSKKGKKSKAKKDKDTTKHKNRNRRSSSSGSDSSKAESAAGKGVKKRDE